MSVPIELATKYFRPFFWRKNFNQKNGEMMIDANKIEQNQTRIVFIFFWKKMLTP